MRIPYTAEICSATVHHTTLEQTNLASDSCFLFRVVCCKLFLHTESAAFTCRPAGHFFLQSEHK